MSRAGDVLPARGQAGRGRGGARAAIARYFARFDEGEVIRWAFRGLLIGAVGVLAMDLHDLIEARRPAVSPPADIATPVLPPAVATRDGEGGAATVDPRDQVTVDEDRLRRPIGFTLKPGGILAAEGFVDIGAAARFATEIEMRGEYVRAVLFNSSGGSLDDAIAIARQIRARGLATGVVDGAFCASSCPLMLAGGVTRSVGAKSAIGLHQFYAVGDMPVEPAQAMSDAQATTARISRHLSEMGVDPALWLHALDTPPRALYYLSMDEMRGYRLATGTGPIAAQ
ncbi:hypothetical protein [Nitratireductor sp. StC3]|uniref:COG3904 family protein n=1 Tax=Nitratireductor sp. StC3 TaxID=2126741 RepID=UPI001FE1C70E|nr:hypothetical protein [Nitratireductor sp. StC3]